VGKVDINSANEAGIGKSNVLGVFKPIAYRELRGHNNTSCEVHNFENTNSFFSSFLRISQLDILKRGTVI
jgi:hypothetical protein